MNDAHNRYNRFFNSSVVLLNNKLSHFLKPKFRFLRFGSCGGKYVRAQMQLQGTVHKATPMKQDSYSV